MAAGGPDVAGGRLPREEYPGVFCDLNPTLGPAQAAVESSRCYYCYDAPCIRACPTKIDIPSFIRKISNGNTRGAAMDILSANIMGGTCARVCPVETLCQEACVREHAEKKPVQIGALQKFATDELFRTGEQPFKRGKPTGKRVAVVGGGPAGLSCAHQLAQLGHEVVVFEAREKAGGLNEYGIAPYKVPDQFAQREVDFILGVGGITVRHGQALGKQVTLEQLRKDYAAVFLGVGLGSTHRLGISGEELPGVMDAVRFIERIRQAGDLAELPVGRHVVVIGGGNTAVDIAIQMKRLGAEFVTLAYRRGVPQMGATRHEQELAQTNGVLIKTWAMPKAIIGTDGGGGMGVQAVELEETRLEAGRLVGTGRTYTLRADQVFKAIGQKLEAGAGLPEVSGGKFRVNERFETSIPGVFAGGDCVAEGEDLTVTSVQHGKLAARAIHERISNG
jgi:dihydropyrimidine dehydrogenase (NAD+) subunit PreT